MKVYFAASISGEAGGDEIKQHVMQTLRRMGHEVISELAYLEGNEGKNAKAIYERDIAWVKDADVIIAEISKISLGVGYELGYKLRDGGTVIALCNAERFKTLSNMIKGISEPNFSLHVWEAIEDIEQILKREIKNLAKE